MARKTFLTDLEAESLLNKMNLSKDDLERAKTAEDLQITGQNELVALAMLRNHYNVTAK